MGNTTGHIFKMSRKVVYKAIDSERNYQDSRWNEETTSSGGQHSPEEWFMYIEDYVNEAKHILSRKNVNEAYPKAMDIMRKVAGMAVAAMEQNGTNNRAIELPISTKPKIDDACPKCKGGKIIGCGEGVFCNKCDFEILI